MGEHDIPGTDNPHHPARWTIALSSGVDNDQRLVDALHQLPAHLIVGDRPRPPRVDFRLALATEPAPPQGQGQHVIVTPRVDETALRAVMRSGAAGVMPADVAIEEAHAILTAVAAGYFPIPHHLTAALATRLEPPPTLVLAERDLIILQHLARGGTIRTIAQRIGCSERHTRRHLRTLWDKMGVQGRAQGLVVAARQGLLDP